MALASLFVPIAATTDSVYAPAFGAVAPTSTLRGRIVSRVTSHVGRRMGGSVLIGLEVFAAFSGSRSPGKRSTGTQ